MTQSTLVMGSSGFTGYESAVCWAFVRLTARRATPVPQ